MSPAKNLEHYLNGNRKGSGQTTGGEIIDVETYSRLKLLQLAKALGYTVNVNSPSDVLERRGLGGISDGKSRLLELKEDFGIDIDVNFERVKRSVLGNFASVVSEADARGDYLSKETLNALAKLVADGNSRLDPVDRRATTATAGV